jgi:uncharacterized protein YkwD
MTLVRTLRSARTMLSGLAVVAVFSVCALTATGPASLVTNQWTPQATAMQPATYKGATQATHASLSTSPYERSTLRRINQVRRAHHLGTLRFASCPNRVATKWSAFLASTHGFYHQSMRRLLNVCHARYAGETLGMGTMTPKKLVSLWMHSPPHRHILLSKSPRRIGIGATQNSRGQWVVAANFMRF